MRPLASVIVPEIRIGILDLYFSAINYGAGYEYAGPFLNGLEIHLLEDLSVKNIEPTEFFISSPFPNPFNNQLIIPIERPTA